MRSGDLNEESELSILLHFQARNVQPLPLPRLESTQPISSFSRLLPQVIQLLVDTCLEETAVANRRRWFCDEPRCDMMHQRFEFPQSFSAFMQ